MATRTKKPFKSSVESLEGRQLCSADIAGALHLRPAIADVAHMPKPETATTPVQVSTNASGSTHSSNIVALSTTAGYQYTAITIKNNSSAKITFDFEWGNGNWKRYTLSPGLQQPLYIAGLNQKATISFEKLYSPGFQMAKYSLTGNNVTFPPGFYLVTPTPSPSSGRAYTFLNISKGVDLFS